MSKNENGGGGGKEKKSNMQGGGQRNPFSRLVLAVCFAANPL
jgi:hypothetical protein